MRLKSMVFILMAFASGSVSAMECDPSGAIMIKISEPEKGLGFKERMEAGQYGGMLAMHPEWRAKVSAVSGMGGTESYNISVSEKWAKQAANAMLSEGASPSQIRAASTGKSYHYLDGTVPHNAVYISIIGELGEAVIMNCK